MNARTMHPKAMMAAAMMMVMVAISVRAASAGSNGGGKGHTVATRTVLSYADGPWTAPVAVVLKSEAAWNAWNENMVARGMAVAAEPAPAGVDWKHESLLVVTLGGNINMRRGVKMSKAERVALHTEVELALAYGQGGTYPCMVVAMARQCVSAVRLTNGEQAGLPSAVPIYNVSPAAGTVNAASVNAASESVAISWGEVKDAYRQ